MLAAEQNEAEQEVPKSICQPWYVRLSGLALTTSCFDPRRALDKGVGSQVIYRDYSTLSHCRQNHDRASS